MKSPYTTLGIPPDGVAWAALVLAAALAIGLRPAIRSRLDLKLPPRLFLPLLAASAALLSGGYVAFYLRGGPRIVDATSYYLQARAMAQGYFAFPVIAPLGAFNGRFLLASAPHALTVIFPPGYASLLALGFLLHAPLCIGPLLAALIVVVSYGLARELSGRTDVARVAAALSLLCGALRYHTADTMSHGWCAFLLCAGTWSALRRTPLHALCSGLAMGWLVATRPVSGAVGAILALCLIERRPRQVARFALGLVPGVALFLAYQRAATGHAFSSTQLAYYALADGPPGCFRYGFGADIGCSFEHGEYVRARLQNGFGLREAAAVTLRRLAVHSIDIANAAPLALLCPLAAWFGASDRRVRVIFFGCLGFMLAYAPFYFDGSYPGGGARLFSDLLPLEHVLLALAIVRLDWTALAVPVSLLGFALHASFGHRALAEREGGRPMFEAEALSRAGVDHGLVFVDTDHGFNLGHDPGQFDAQHHVVVARYGADAHDFRLWQRLGSPKSFRYLYSPRSPGAAVLVPYTPQSLPLRFESEREWPPLAVHGGWVTPDFAPCASAGRGLRLHPTGPTTSVGVEFQLTGSGDAAQEVIVGWVRDTGSASTLAVRRSGSGVSTSVVVPAGPSGCVAANLGPQTFSADGETIELTSSRAGLLDYIELRPFESSAH